MTIRRQIIVLALVVAVGVAVVMLTWRSEPTHAAGRDVRVPASTALSASTNDALAAGALAPCPQPQNGVNPVPALADTDATCLGSRQQLNMGAALAGRPVLVNVWASWCAPCRDEMPVLDRYAHTPGAIEVVGINVQDRPAAAVALMTDLKIGYPSFRSADGVSRALSAPPVLPLSYVIRADGSVRRVTTVAVFDDVSQVRDAVSAMSQSQE